MIGIGLAQAPYIDKQLVSTAVAEALEGARARRHSDSVQQVLVFATEPMAPFIADMGALAVRESRSLQVHGGIVQGLFAQGTLVHGVPAVLALALSGPSKNETDAMQITCKMGAHDAHFASRAPSANDANEAEIGLLSFSSVSGPHPRLQSGRPEPEGQCSWTIKAKRIHLLESIGLQPLGDWGPVTRTQGWTLHEVSGQAALAALSGPEQNTRPIGLRVGVRREGLMHWIPLVSVNADGSMTLASPVHTGEEVCLAARTDDCAQAELDGWQASLPADDENHRWGLIMGGFERSPMCRSTDTELTQIQTQWPNLPLVGLFGQASWVRSPGMEPKTLALNHRLAMTVIEGV